MINRLKLKLFLCLVLLVVVVIPSLFLDDIQSYLKKMDGRPVFRETVSSMGVQWNEFDVQYQYKQERWDDPVVLETPRLQFVWARPDKPENDIGIWSMKLDGSDIREVVPHDLFSLNDTLGPSTNVKYERSPNNRYIAYAIFGNGYGRRVIDLETKENIFVGEGGGNPRFTWATSRYLLFKDKRSVLTQYDTETGESTNIIERFEEWDSGPWYRYEYDTVNNFLRRFTEDFVLVYDFTTGKIVKKADRSEFPGMQTYHPDYRIVYDRHSKQHGTPNYLVHSKTGEITKLNQDQYGAITVSLGKGFNFTSTSDGLKRVLKEGEVSFEAWILPKERSAYNMTIYNVNAKTLKALQIESRQ